MSPAVATTSPSQRWPALRSVVDQDTAARVPGQPDAPAQRLEQRAREGKTEDGPLHTGDFDAQAVERLEEPARGRFARRMADRRR